MMLCHNVWIRRLSSAQVATALRPFYFLVHPDLFGRWPSEQAVNEGSLKQLKSHLNVMLDEKRRPSPLQATFYVKSRTAPQRKNLRKITLKLGSEVKIRKTVAAILSSVELPTSYVDSIPDNEVHLSQHQPVFYAYEDTAEFESEQAQLDLMHPTDVRRPLPTWLKDNVENAQLKMAKSEPVRLQSEKLQDQLCQELNLIDLHWDQTSWDISYKRGVLASFSNLLKDHGEVIQSILSGRTLVFGHESGMSLDGQIILYTGEVRSNWLNVIRNIPNFEKSLESIPLVEKALSQNLREIRIVHRKNQPLRLVDDYKNQLKKLVTNVSDFLTKQKLPEKWPDSMQEFQLCVDNESSPLTLSPTGQFIVPASCPGFLLIPFITENLAKARKMMAKVDENKMAELELSIKCINELGLIQLERDDSLETEAMIQSCQRLLKAAPNIRHLTHGNHIVVTRYYSVNSDGVICIPWNWKLTF